MNYHTSILPYSLDKGHPCEFNENGVLVSKIPYGKTFYYHGTAIASYAIINFDSDRNSFFSQIDWLQDNIDDDGAIRHKFDIISYDNVKAPWVGGLAQGLSISAMVLAYSINKEKDYLQCAEKLFNGMLKHCIYLDKDYNLWISEYPGVHSILNGFIYSLFGIHDLMIVTESKRFKIETEKIWSGGIKTLLSNLYLYDMNYWSLYDQYRKYPATDFYHKIHIEQLEELYKLTDNLMFHTYAKRWRLRLTTFNKTRASIKKVAMQDRNNGVIELFKRWRKYRKWMKD